ncbi:hypothetical protein BV25DRAFT_1870555 [Artomyces pyxidatus]|uniref:Uncharacterized protein n=1 Tax=Artomyces pyxidatus TaxID=48021 RepID=A0ACB8T1A9_9AGAM|nr:hypothetical protein BV25DRAFT_1870555 [Artomyces pyxidatus]
MLSNVFTALALFAVGAAAQSSSAVPSGVPGLDACILTCLTQATASGGCSSFTDLQCVCTSTAFQSAAQQCLTSQCTQADQQAALQLQQSQCASSPSLLSLCTRISSAASSVSSTESAATSTLTSAQSSLSSSVSSVLSSLSSKAASETSAASSALSSVKSSLSSVVSSATSAAATSNSAGARVAFDSMGGVLTLGFAVLGAIAGGAMVI